MVYKIQFPISLAFAISVLGLLSPLQAAESPRSIELCCVQVDPAKTICQMIVPIENACTPSVFLNALRFGPPLFQKIFNELPGRSDKEKLARIIEKEGSLPSYVKPGHKIFDPKIGVFADDFPKYFNALLKKADESITGMYFDVGENEKPEAHLRRIHGLLLHSLKQGVPVSTSVRSFAALLKGDAFLWDGIAGHAILIVGVPKVLPPDAQGILFEFIEPSTGRVREGYIFSETVRGFKAAKGSGAKVTWVEGGFLQIVAPSLNINTAQQPWFARTFLTLNYGVGRFNEKK